MKHNMHKLVAIGLSGTVLISSLAGCASENEAVVSDTIAEADQIAQAAGTLLHSHSDSAGKVETVYVIADAEGHPTETIVSVWLKNPNGKETLDDVSDLTGIVSTKGSETYTETAEGRLTWAANGSDIYYQGTTDRELPVTTFISYELDGETVSAEELAGASGHLIITFDYQNTASVQREINGETVTLYYPFLVISGLVLDEDKSANVTVTNGKIVSTGDRSIAVGMAMPGLRESLGLDTMENRNGEPIDIDLPERVVIEADVTDFELLTTVTIISNDLMQQLDLDDVETIDDLKDTMEELTDASTQLKDGTEELYDSVEELSDGTADLTDGIVRLDDGAGDLQSGAEELSSGMGQLTDGANTLSQGASTLAGGAVQVSDGAAALDDGMQTLNESAPALVDGAAAAAEGAAALSEGAASLDEGAQTLSENMTALSDGLDSANTGAASLEMGLTQMQTSVADLPAGVDTLYQGTYLVKTALKNDEGQSLYAGAQSIENGAAVLSDGLTGENSILTAANGISSGAEQLAVGADNISAAAENLQNVLGGLIAEADSISPAIIALIGADTFNSYLEQANTAYIVLGQIKDGADGISNGLVGEGASIQNAANGIAGGAQQLDAGAAQIEAGAQALETGIDTLVSDDNLGAILAGLAELSESSGALVEGVDALAASATLLSEGVGSAADGASQLADGASDLKDGTSQVAAGASTLSNGVTQLSEGASAAADGISQLADGTSGLKDGADQVAAGAGSLAEGAEALAEGASSAADGTAQLAEGAGDLKDGMSQLRDGGAELADGVAQLLEGAEELRDGMAEFDEEGIQALSQLVEDDAQEFIDRLRAVQELSMGYTSFDGGNSSVPGTVQFIVRTESIEK